MLSFFALPEPTAAVEEKLTVFDKIYQTAKTRNIKAIKDILQTGACLEVRRGYHTPISLLAAEGQFLAVEFLLARFGGSLNNAVYGYGLGGYVDQCKDLVDRGASENDAVFGLLSKKLVTEAAVYKAALDTYKVMGCARGGDTDKVNYMLLSNSRDIKCYAARGYGLAGNIPAINNLLTRNKTMPSLVNEAIWGLAVENHEGIKPFLQNQEQNESAIQGYAYGGHKLQVNKLLKEYPLALKYALCGYAEGGHWDIVLHLLEQNKNHAEYKLFISYAIRLFSKGGNINQAYKLIKSGESFDGAVAEYSLSFKLSNRHHALHSLSFMSEGVRKKVVAKVSTSPKSKLVCSEIVETEKLASRISQSMQAGVDHYDCCLIWHCPEYVVLKGLLLNPVLFSSDMNVSNNNELLCIIASYFLPHIKAEDISLFSTKISLFAAQDKLMQLSGCKKSPDNSVALTA